MTQLFSGEEIVAMDRFLQQHKLDHLNRDTYCLPHCRQDALALAINSVIVVRKQGADEYWHMRLIGTEEAFCLQPFDFKGWYQERYEEGKPFCPRCAARSRARHEAL